MSHGYVSSKISEGTGENVLRLVSHERGNDTGYIYIYWKQGSSCALDRPVLRPLRFIRGVNKNRSRVSILARFPVGEQE